MSERFVFHPHPPLQSVLNALATPKGDLAVNQVLASFSSLVDALHHTQAVGSSTVIHLPDAETITFVNAPRREVAHAALLIAEVNGFNIG